MHRLLTQRVTPRFPREEFILREYLSHLGIEVDGHRSYDVCVRNPAFYRKVVSNGIHGALDTYVDGWWDCERLDELTARVVRGPLQLPASGRFTRYWTLLRARAFNLQSRRRSLQVQEHYDLGNDLFLAMLDRRLVYSCAYWTNATSLDDAQLAKLDLVARKLALRPGMRVLDIGCGWGSFAKYAAERYGIEVVGITISKQQYELGKTLCRQLPVELRFQDYRDLNDPPYDAVVSIGMLEHVGYKNYRRFLQTVRRNLKPEGPFLLQTIGANESRVNAIPWIQQNIFSVGMIPSLRQIATAAEGLFVTEDWQNFGVDYDKTLMAWYENFQANWPSLRDRYGPRFFRMWKCYLLTCAGAFRARQNQLWQIVFSPSGISGGYAAMR
jgi:cyclopropane-fatty-acyl-phospholipid synthase